MYPRSARAAARPPHRSPSAPSRPARRGAVLSSVLLLALLPAAGRAAGEEPAASPPPGPPPATAQTPATETPASETPETEASATELPDTETPDTETPPTQASRAEEPVPQGPGLQIYEELDVRQRGDDLVGIASSATEGSTGAADLEKRPILRPGELVETVPGVVATQHSGGGKANQYFVRGFNLDHGTDFSVSVAGVPVNMPTHGHGQGYADLGFLIPELVERVAYRKGPYFAEAGDFSAAGGADLEIVRALPDDRLVGAGGSYDFGRLLWAGSRTTESGGDLLAAVDVFQDDGPWDRPEDYDGLRALGRYTAGDSLRGYSVTAMAYDADWLSTDQVPRRAVDAGRIDRFGLIDAGPRGDTRRLSLSAELHRGTSTELSRLSGYLLHYDFGLISNFTYFLDDPEDGDQFEQSDRRLAAGFDLRRSRRLSWAGRPVEASAGVQGRFDDIDNGLFRTRDLERTATVRRDSIQQLGAGVWADALVRWSDRVRTRLGLRGDAFWADVESDLAANSGRADDVLLSPKLSLILGPWNDTEVYVNLGRGFHSNDARGAVVRVDPASGDRAERVDPLVAARGADVGVRTTAVPGLQTTLTAFAIELDSELVFVGDGGATEASRPSRRLGIEWANFYQPTPWLSLDLDLTWTDAEFTDRAPEGDEIPGAVGRTVAAGVAVTDLAGFSGGLRWRHFGDVPLIEDGSVEWGSASLVNARLGYGFAVGLEVTLEVFNLLDARDSDVEYYYASRLPGEPPGGVEDIHFHPMPGRSARLTASWRW